MKLTQANADKAKLPTVYPPDHKKAGKPVKSDEWIYWDDHLPGFGLRIRNGSKTWVVQYKIGAKHRRRTLGSVHELTAEQARNGWKGSDGEWRDGASTMLAERRQGIDAADKKAHRQAGNSDTLGATIDAFLEYQREYLRPRSLEETTRYLRDHWKPLHGFALKKITPAQVAAGASKIKAKRGKVAAARARSALSTFFAWAVGDVFLCERNPVMATKRKRKTLQEKLEDRDNDNSGRKRTLSDAEIAAIWNAADPATDFGKIVRLLFTTACRRNEIGGLRGSEIALGDSLIALPGERTKNSRAHNVPLSGLARKIVESLELDSDGCVFGKRGTGFSGWSKSKRELSAALKINQPWTLHDIRRTVATRMESLGVLPVVTDAVLNHASGHKAGVTGTYQRYDYAEEKRAALDTWASHLKTLIAGAGNVRRLARA